MEQTAIIFDFIPLLFSVSPVATDTIHYMPSDDGLHILEQCRAPRQKNGKRLHTLLALSNIDIATLGHLHDLFPYVFSHFDGIMLADMVGYRKPDTKIFHHLFDRFSLKPGNTIFIDMNAAHVLAAHELGMKAILHKSYPITENILKHHNIL